MAQSSPYILQRIEALIRLGKQQESRLLLLEYIRSDPGSAQAWRLLSQVTNEPHEQIDCLERLLQLDPGDLQAQERLASLQATLENSAGGSPSAFSDSHLPLEETFASSLPADPSGSPIPADPSQPVEQQTEGPFLPTSSEPVPAEPAPRKKSNTPLQTLEILLGLLLVASVVFMISFYLKGRHAQAAEEQATYSRETQAISLLLTQIPTNTSTNTQAPALTQTEASTGAFTPTGEPRFTETPPPTDQVRPKAGFYAPNFNLVDVKSGQRFSLGQFKGRPVLVYFCTTASPDCAEELDIMVALDQNSGEEGLILLAIYSGESTASLERYQKSKQIDFPLLVDLNSAVKNLYQVQSIPAYYFIDANAKIISIQTGLLTYPQLVEQVKKISP